MTALMKYLGWIVGVCLNGERNAVDFDQILLNIDLKFFSEKEL